MARNTSFIFKGQSINVQTVARDLGVRCILEGSVRKAGNQVRITAQLIDGVTRRQWRRRCRRRTHRSAPTPGRRTTERSRSPCAISADSWRRTLPRPWRRRRISGRDEGLCAARCGTRSQVGKRLRWQVAFRSPGSGRASGNGALERLHNGLADRKRRNDRKIQSSGTVCL